MVINFSQFKFRSRETKISSHMILLKLFKRESNFMLEKGLNSILICSFCLTGLIGDIKWINVGAWSVRSILRMPEVKGTVLLNHIWSKVEGEQVLKSVGNHVGLVTAGIYNIEFNHVA